MALALGVVLDRVGVSVPRNTKTLSEMEHKPIIDAALYCSTEIHSSINPTWHFRDLLRGDFEVLADSSLRSTQLLSSSRSLDQCHLLDFLPRYFHFHFHNHVSDLKVNPKVNEPHLSTT